MFLSDEETEKLILSLASARGNKGFTEADAQKIVDWANEMRIGEAALANVLDGLLTVDVREDGEIMFGQTEAGLKVAEKLISPNDRFDITPIGREAIQNGEPH